MTPKEFINTDVKYGDKVRLETTDGKTVDCFFGGWKTFGCIEGTLEYIMPVFYAPNSKGEMGNRSAFGPNTCTNIPYGQIKSLKIIKPS
jgi:hypothetical protein